MQSDSYMDLDDKQPLGQHLSEGKRSDKMRETERICRQSMIFTKLPVWPSRTTASSPAEFKSHIYIWRKPMHVKIKPKTRTVILKKLKSLPCYPQIRWPNKIRWCLFHKIARWKTICYTVYLSVTWKASKIWDRLTLPWIRDFHKNIVYEHYPKN